MKEPARLVRRRFAEVVAYFEHPYANAVLEGVDSVVRNVKRRACGFRDMDYCLWSNKRVRRHHQI